VSYTHSKAKVYKAILAISIFLCCLSRPIAYAKPLRNDNAKAFSNIKPLLYSGLLVTAEVAIKDIAISYASSYIKNNYPKYWETQYRTSGVYGGGMPYGFFIPLEQYKPYHAWWDTGILLTGSGIGTRQVLPQRWLDQDWFIGVYGYYDVMSNLAQDLTILTLQYINGSASVRDWIRRDLPYRLLQHPIRLNIGFELGGSDWGQLTANLYGMLLPDMRPGCTVRERGGISASASVNLYPTLQPFICGSVSFIERQYGLIKKGLEGDLWARIAGMASFEPETVTSVALGFRWVMNPAVDFEMKYFLYDSHHYQMPIHCGFTFRYNSKGADKFQGRLNQPPARHIPYYPYALTFHPTFFMFKSMADSLMSQYTFTGKGEAR
jgi:hypothetical protein